MTMQNSTRLFVISVLCGALSACGAGGSSTDDVDADTNPVTPSVTVTEPDNTPDSGDGTAGEPDTTAITEPVTSEPGLGNAHDSELPDTREFTVKLESVTVRRRSNGEVLPVEISHISSGLLTVEVQTTNRVY